MIRGQQIPGWIGATSLAAAAVLVIANITARTPLPSSQSHSSNSAGSILPALVTVPAIDWTITSSEVESHIAAILEWHTIRAASPDASLGQLTPPDELDLAQRAVNELIRIGNLPADQRPKNLPDLEPMLEAMYATRWPSLLNYWRTAVIVRLLPTAEARSRMTLQAMQVGALAPWTRRDYELLSAEHRECLIDEAMAYTRAETLEHLHVFDSIAAMQSPRSAKALEHARRALLEELDDPQGTLWTIHINQQLDHFDALIEIACATTAEQLLVLVPYEAERWSLQTKWILQRASALGARAKARQLVLDSRARWSSVLRAQILRARANPPVKIPLKNRIKSMVLGPSMNERVLMGEQIMLPSLKAWGIEAGLLIEDDWTDISSEPMFAFRGG